jgi:hypothetical protein
LDNERKNIIKDSDHHMEGVNVISVTGVNDLNSLVNLDQDVTTSIHHLLLAIPARGTSSNKLFLQIEWQAGNDWLHCCFYTTDFTAVSLCLGSLESLLKKYVKIEDPHKVFSSKDLSL